MKKIKTLSLNIEVEGVEEILEQIEVIKNAIEKINQAAIYATVGIVKENDNRR